MLVLDFIRLLRSHLGDTEIPYLWEDDELVFYLNQTIREIADEFNIYRYDNQEVKTVANTYQYSVIGEPVRAVIGYFSLEPVSQEIINADIQVGLTGLPTEFYGANGTIMVYPIPDAEYTMYVTVRKIPEYGLGDTIDFSDTELLLLGCMYRAHTKQDSEIFNGQSLTALYQLYTARLNRLKTHFIRDRNREYPSFIHPGLL